MFDLLGAKKKETQLEGSNLQQSIYLPIKTVEALKKELSIPDVQIASFLISLIEKTIYEHIRRTNSNVFSDTETEEIESSLKGLGYI
jgi:hypothetical protein